MLERRECAGNPCKWLVCVSEDDGESAADGRTLLMHACAQSDVDRRRVVDVVKYLVDDLRADVAAVDRRGRTALYHAVEAGQQDAAAYLLARPAARQRLVDADRRSLLVAAVAAGRPDMVSLLLQSAAVGRQLATLTDAAGRGPVHHWATTSSDDATPDDKARRAAILLDLVAHRCDCGAPDDAGVTALMSAAGGGRTTAVGALLQLRDGGAAAAAAAVDADAADARGRTALHHCCAATPPSLRCCRALVRAGADANAADTAGVTPLMLACQAYVPGANVAVIRYLVEKGSADPVKQDCEGRDSYDYCPPIDSQYVRAVLRSASGRPAVHQHYDFHSMYRCSDVTESVVTTRSPFCGHT